MTDYWLAAAPLVCLIIGPLCMIGWFHWTHRRILAVARQLPSEFLSLPLIGQGYIMLTGIQGVSSLLINSLKTAGLRRLTTFVAWFGPYPLYMISEPEDIQTVLNSSKALERGHEVEYLKHALGNGLITAPVHIWKVTRRHINPMFHPRNIELLITALNECGRELSANLSRHVGCGDVDVDNDVYIITIKSVSCLVFGPDIGLNIPDDHCYKFITAVNSIGRIVLLRLWRVWLWPDRVFQFLYKKELKEVDRNWRNLIKQPLKVIEQNRMNQRYECISTRHKNSNIQHETEGHIKQITLADAYDEIQRNHPNFNKEDFKHELTTLLMAGSETSRISLCSCILSLAANPEVQERLYAEVVSVVGRQDTDVTLEHLKAMPYLDQVLNETLRKYLPVPAVPRKLQGDLKLGSLILPAGSTVGISIAGVHFDSKYYPDPERFDPDRFSPENVAQRPKYSFIPFSVGTRNCIGKSYSIMTLKILLVHFIRRYKVSTKMDTDNLRYMFGVAVHCADGYNVDLQSRI